jgi:UDP-N-acetylmuramoylalanine--D-glutamate ligase
VKKLVVLGAGESGVGAALLAKKQGWDVFVSDAGKIKEKYQLTLTQHGISFEEGKHTESEVINATEVVKSPGIPGKAPLIRKLKEQGVSVIGELEFAARYSKARYVGITGSNGKTTTTLLIYHILKKAGVNVGLGGNVGQSFAKIVAEGDPYEWMVLEVSSFQLDDMVDFKCDVALILNITEDHLDRYEYKLMNYARSKMRITQNQTEADWFVYCQDDPVTMEVMREIKTAAKHAPFSIQHKVDGPGAFQLNNEQLCINPLGNGRDNNPLIMTIQELALQGKHNLYNSMAAGIASRILEVRKDLIRECLADFQNIEHRLEPVNEVYGISFINDSKATNVNSSWYALESMSKPVVWIAGGVDKGNDYSLLHDMVKSKVKAIVCLGKDNAKLHEAFADVVEHIVDASNMRDAVYAAYKAGAKGDAVLLSPACASFDLFEDYEDRGRQFKEAVRNL